MLICCCCFFCGVRERSECGGDDNGAATSVRKVTNKRSCSSFGPATEDVDQQQKFDCPSDNSLFLPCENEGALGTPAYQHVFIQECQEVRCGCAGSLHDLLCTAEGECELELHPTHTQAKTRYRAAAAEVWWWCITQTHGRTTQTRKRSHRFSCSVPVSLAASPCAAAAHSVDYSVMPLLRQGRNKQKRVGGGSGANRACCGSSVPPRACMCHCHSGATSTFLVMKVSRRLHLGVSTTRKWSGNCAWDGALQHQTESIGGQVLNPLSIFKKTQNISYLPRTSLSASSTWWLRLPRGSIAGAMSASSPGLMRS